MSVLMGESRKRNASSWTRHSAVGLQFALVIVLFTYGGHWLERRFDVSPWGTVIGAGLGFLGGTVWLYHQVYPRSSDDACPGDER